MMLIALEIHAENLQMGTGCSEHRQECEVQRLVMPEVQVTEVGTVGDKIAGKIFRVEVPAVGELQSLQRTRKEREEVAVDNGRRLNSQGLQLGKGADGSCERVNEGLIRLDPVVAELLRRQRRAPGS